jgi:hypothetical protein
MTILNPVNYEERKKIITQTISSLANGPLITMSLREILLKVGPSQGIYEADLEETIQDEAGLTYAQVSESCNLTPAQEEVVIDCIAKSKVSLYLSREPTKFEKLRDHYHEKLSELERERDELIQERYNTEMDARRRVARERVFRG